MKKIEFINGQAPYLNDQNLNQMQDNMEEVSVPEGGIRGQVLRKVSNTDNDIEWSTIIEDTLESESPMDALSARQGKILNEKLLDTDWTTVTLSDSFKPYNNISMNTPEYRKIGKLVEIWGYVSPTSEIAAGGSATIFTLPEGYRPPKGLNFLCQGSGKNNWLLTIDAEGIVGFSRYGTNANAAAGTTALLVFNAMFFVD